MLSSKTIFIVEDDASVITTLRWMLTGQGATVREFSCPSSILTTPVPETPSCLLVDLRLPEMDGLTLLRQLRKDGWQMPFIIMSGHGNVRSTVSAMKLGAVDFLEKPLIEDLVLSSIHSALNSDSERMAKAHEALETSARISLLTRREDEVLDLIVDGNTSREIGDILGVKLKTVETHRSSIMRKLEVDSVAKLVREIVQFRASTGK